MTDGFTRRKEQSKDEIRQAAWELFGQFGVEKVSMVDIARKAGVSQATIYNNFGSKEALAREFVTAVIDQLVKRTEEVLSPNMPFWEKMAGVIQFISAMMAQGRSLELDIPVFSISFDLLNDPEIKKIRNSALERMTVLLLRLVQEGKEQGHIHSELSEDAYKIYFKAFMEIFADPQFRQGYNKNPDLIQDLGSLMIYGLRGQNSGDFLHH